MNEQSFLPAKDIIDRFTILKRQNEEITAELFKTAINEHYSRGHNAGSFLSTVSSVISVSEELLGRYQSLKARYDEENRLHSSGFNMLRLFSIGETMHSYLLAKLLDPNSEHGQGKLLLKLFLEMLEIEDPEEGHWTVTAETGRIDVLLKRKHPHSVIVIENKSNYAPDQQNQLYRYWYQEIYYPNSRHNKSYTYQPEDTKRYQLIYLSPDATKIPADHSLTRPAGLPDELPARVPIEPKLFLFNREIVNWLQKVLEHLPASNLRFREYVKQYIEFWS